MHTYEMRLRTRCFQRSFLITCTRGNIAMHKRERGRTGMALQVLLETSL